MTQVANRPISTKKSSEANKNALVTDQVIEGKNECGEVTKTSNRTSKRIRGPRMPQNSSRPPNPSVNLAETEMASQKTPNDLIFTARGGRGQEKNTVHKNKSLMS